MMKSSGLVGIPICLTTGEQLSTVRLVVVDPEQHLILGFLANWGGWAGSAQILPWSSDLHITSKAIEIPSASLIVPVGRVPHIRKVLEGPSVSKGTLITTTDKHMLGALQDVQFDSHTGAVHSYNFVFSRGEVAGRQTQVTPNHVTFDRQENALLIPTLVAAEMQESARGSD